MNEYLRVLTQKIPKLPTIPRVADRIIELVGSRSAYMDDLVETIEKDPAIAAKVISFSNAAFYRMGGSVTSIGDSVMKIGFDNVKSIALSISLLTIFKSDNSRRTDQYATVIRHCMATGLIAREIAEEVKSELESNVFTCGLLHDLGLMVLINFFPDIFDKMLKDGKPGKPFVAAENDVYGFNHGDVGAWLADKWNLPEDIYEGIQYHHYPSAAAKHADIAAMVHIADNMAIKMGISPIATDPYGNAYDESAADHIRLTDKRMAAVEKRAAELIAALGEEL